MFLLMLLFVSFISLSPLGIYCENMIIMMGGKTRHEDWLSWSKNPGVRIRIIQQSYISLRLIRSKQKAFNPLLNMDSKSRVSIVDGI